MNRVKPRLRSRSWDHHERVVPWLGLLLLLLISTTTTSSNTALPPPSFEGLNTVPVTLSERDFGIAAMGVANQLYNEYDREFELVDLTRLEMHVCSSIVPSIHLSIAHTHHTLAGTSECQVLHSYGKASQAPSSLVWSIRAIVCRSIHGRVRDATLSLAIASHLEHAIQPCYRSMDSKCRSDSDATSRHRMSCRVGGHDAWGARSTTRVPLSHARDGAVARYRRRTLYDPPSDTRAAVPRRPPSYDHCSRHCRIDRWCLYRARHTVVCGRPPPPRAGRRVVQRVELQSQLGASTHDAARADQRHGRCRRGAAGSALRPVRA